MNADSILDRTYNKLTTEPQLARDEVLEVMDELIQGLHGMRQKHLESEWKNFCKSEARNHSLRTLLQQDPFTKRSVDKPRGFSGDAVLLDYIYRGIASNEASGLTKLGQDICAYTAGASASARAVRSRCKYAASIIDSISVTNPKCRILSVACGHLFEVEESPAVQSGGVGALVGLDQDPLALQTVKERYANFKVEIVNASIKDLIRGTIDLGSFDFIYCSGLYDYLPQTQAVQLTNNLFGTLCSNGRLLIGNFFTGYGTQAYMESMMDWRLLTRSEDDMLGLLSTTSANDILRKSTYLDSDVGYIVYLDATKV